MKKEQKPNTVVASTDDVRFRMDVDALKRAIQDNLTCVQGKFPQAATPHDWFMAVAYTVRDHVMKRWADTASTYLNRQSRTVCYLSAEYLLGPHLENSVLCLGMQEAVRQAVTDLGLDWRAMVEMEEDPGLGNGGLGRLAACFMDSLATLDMPALGYGIRYEYGIFTQVIRDGRQHEVSDSWLRQGNPWELPRPEISYEVGFGGRTDHYKDVLGRHRVRWVPATVVHGVAYDTPIPGFRTNNVNLLRLWKSEASVDFDFQAFNTGNYALAVDDKVRSENISKVLYPNDTAVQGKELRLSQQYFFVSCSLRDMIRIYQQKQKDLSGLADKYALQMNDTHPAIAVAELMRLLVDEHLLPWEQAWDITRKMCNYTNHTLMPEALEKWPFSLFGRILPRHLEIILEINRRFLEEVRTRFPGDEALVQRVSLIEDRGERYVRMAYLACVGSASINGVAELHTELLRQDLLADFDRIWPEKFQNKTNGISPRRFLALANPRLSSLMDEKVDPSWRVDLDKLRGLEKFAGDAAFRDAWMKVKRQNKVDLAAFVQHRVGLKLNPDSIFDVQVKRIHEYKRQHLDALHIIALWRRLRDGRGGNDPPRTFIFGGKAAPGYRMAKLIVRLIHGIADVVNKDKHSRDHLRVVFVPDFNVSVANRIYPAAEVSEQISLAGMEASGTGNMKMALNGALTVGTLDGANIEIRDAVGKENFFMFGMTAEEVAERKAAGYRPQEVARKDDELAEVLDLIASGTFCESDRDELLPLAENLLQVDNFMVLADYRAYVECQERVAKAYKDAHGWTRMSILNSARVGHFSSDRTIREYAKDIWKVVPVQVG
jgi:starch phosphorylase